MLAFGVQRVARIATPRTSRAVNAAVIPREDGAGIVARLLHIGNASLDLGFRRIVAECVSVCLTLGRDCLSQRQSRLFWGKTCLEKLYDALISLRGT